MSSQAQIADIWILDPNTLTPADIARCNAAISTAEKARCDKFRFEPDRDAYRAAHALARFALSWCERAVPPQAWVFEQTSRGRPEIAASGGFPSLRFNISHTRQLVACIVTRALDCGVDVESIDRCSDLRPDAHAVLAPAELARIAGASDAERPTLLCRYWTLKEAYAKALGLGMSLAFEDVAFVLHDGYGRLQTHSDEWHFAQWSPASTHILATAVRARGPVRLVRHCGMPRNVLAKKQISGH